MLSNPIEFEKYGLDLNNLWQMTLSKASASAQIVQKISAVDCQLIADEKKQNQQNLTWQIERPAKITVRVQITTIDNRREISATLVNETSDFCIREFAWQGIRFGNDNAALLFPQGAGRRVTDFSDFSISTQYPSYLFAMPWIAMDHDEGGVYLGMHDPDDDALGVDLKQDNAANALNIKLTRYPFVMPGKQVQLPCLVIENYEGHWAKASKIYRHWYDSIGSVATIPNWMQNNSGWLLAILKQQNESVLYDYTTGIDHLADVAIERGLDTLGLFGWTVGGHDHQYPHYDPDPKLGGREGLKAAIKRAKDRGLRVILYSNGVIMDVASPFYRKQGKNAAVRLADGRVNLSQINKFKDTTPVVYATGCLGSKAWQAVLLNLAIQAHDLGADGLLYDQVGVYGPQECHHPDHDHDTPMQAFSTSRVNTIKQIAEHMQKIDDQFIIATESFIAPLGRDMHMIHGLGFGYGLTHCSEDSDEVFPDLLRLTFPEVVSTNRIPQPLFDRRVGHFAVMHGLRQEIEVRYHEDAQLIAGEKLDWKSAYKTPAGSPPVQAMIEKSIAQNEKQYMAKLMAFVRKHEAVFYRGTYMADQGFELQSKHIQARGYVTDENSLGIALWNPSEKQAGFTLEVQGKKLVQVDQVEGELANGFEPMAAESIRLLIYK